MAVDIVAASRRPLQRLLLDSSFSEWKDIALFLDGGSVEAVRWAGGLSFVLAELGISHVLDLEAFAPGRGGTTRAPESEGLNRGIFLVTTFVWDVEGAVLNASRTYGLTEVTVACSVSEEAHACHRHADHISEETGGRVSFSVMSQQLKVSLERMLKIEAQSSGSSRRRFSAAATSSPSGVLSPASPPTSIGASPCPPAITNPPTEHSRDPFPSVLVAIVHSPLHIGCFFQSPPTTSTTSSLNCFSRRQTAEAKGHHHQRKGCSTFSLASPACAQVFPLRRCDWEGGGGGGAGAALFAAAAAVEGEGAGDGSATGRHMSAEEVPREERLRYRLLAHTLAEALWDQLLLDVSGGGCVFTLGDTSRLIGTTLAAAAEDKKRVTLDTEGGGTGRSGAGLGGDGSRSATRREASVILVDRTLDLAAAASHGGSLLQRILSSIPRTGTPIGAASAPSPSASDSDAPDWPSTAAAHQQDVGVVLPMLAPGLGLPACTVERRAAAAAAAPGAGGGGCAEREKSAPSPGLLPMSALASVSWPAPPSLCHTGGSADAEGLVHAIVSLGEEEGQAALITALEKCVLENGCTPPPRKRRGMGASIMALVTSLAKGNPPGGLSGDRVCFRCRGVMQVALAAMEAHQRTSSQAGSGWAETVGAERVQLQQLREGSTVDVVMEQLCAMLKRSSPTCGSGSFKGVSSLRQTMLLALRGVSLAGESIGAEDATSFRKAWISRVLAGGFREEGSGIPSRVAEAVERLCFSRERRMSRTPEAGGDGCDEESAEEAGVLLELEDIARERIQRLREAAASRSFLLKNTAVLRDLAFEPYTFVATAVAAAEAGGGSPRDGSGGDGGRGGGEGWDDWGDDETAQGTSGYVQGQGASTEYTTECDTLVGRLAGLLLDPYKPDVPDLREAKLVSAASVGLGLLSSGLKRLGRMGEAAGAMGRGRQKTSRPTDRPVVVVFVVGGITPLEVAEVSNVLRCASAAAATTAPGGGLETEIIVAGTTMLTPDVVYEQIFTRPPAGQG